MEHLILNKGSLDFLHQERYPLLRRERFPFHHSYDDWDYVLGSQEMFSEREFYLEFDESVAVRWLNNAVS